MKDRDELRVDIQPTFPDLVTLGRRRAETQGSQRAYGFLMQGETLDAVLTYDALDRRARAIATQLQQQGLAGRAALLLYPQGLEFIAAFLGCVYAEVVAVPINAPQSRAKRGHWHRLLTVLDDAQAPLVLCGSENLQAMQTGLNSVREDETLQWLATDTLDERLAEQWRPPEVSGDTLAFLQYTSGSTSNPKGVMVSHGNLLHNLEMMKQTFGHDSSTVMVSWLPLFHDLGLIGIVLQSLYLGSCAYLMPPAAFLQKPLRWLRAIATFRATSSMSPNFGYELSARRISAEQRAALDLSSWTHAPNAAEPIRANTLDAFVEAFAPCGFPAEAFFPGYGLAEATLMVTGSRRGKGAVRFRFDDEALARHRAEPAEGGRALVSSGRVIGDQSVVITRDGEALGEGHIGEIWLQGPSVAKGYWRRDEATRDIFGARLNDGGGPYLRTGDLGFLLDGELFITGRNKELIIVHGKNHYPQDIEQSVQAAHEALRHDHGAAFAVDVHEEEHLVVVQEVERTWMRKVDDDVLDAVKRAVAEQHDIRVHEVVLIRTNTLPKTSSGKIQRLRARQQYLNGELTVVTRTGVFAPDPHLVQQVAEPSAAPTFSELRHLETYLIGLIAPMLDMRPQDLRPDRAFTHYGLSSQMVIGLSGELSEALKRELPPTLLYDYPNVSSLARFLAGVADETPAATHARRGELDEPIAVVGVGMRFPNGIEDLDALWALLEAGEDVLRETPADRWDTHRAYYPKPGTPGKMSTMYGGFLDGVDTFDADFFGISAYEARRMDPQQRLVLEIGWRALEDAGIRPDQLAGSATGVFLGISGAEYAQLHGDLALDAQTGMGVALSIAANRLSYVLDLHGPSMALDTACSSGLTAIHLASQNLRLGECNLALAGGVNLMLSDHMSIMLSQAGMLSTGKGCRAFDADADGYVRGEGCGMVVLKRLSDALRDGDHIHAVIRGSSVNQDGTGHGLMAPNGHTQEAVIAQALAAAQVAPADVDYVEAHGTGAPLGDAIEAQALGKVFRQDRPEIRPLRIGSVKTNLGHLEAASGMAGLFKVILAMARETLPANPRIDRPNPQIPWRDLKVEIVRQAHPWVRGERPRLVGLNAFGIGGANAHLILEEPPTLTPREVKPTRTQILTLSAREETALEILVEGFAERLRTSDVETWIDLCFSANTGRRHFSRRLAVVGDSPQDMAAQLQSGNAYRGSRSDDHPMRLGFVFGDMPFNQALEALIVAQPFFAKTLRDVYHVIETLTGAPVPELLLLKERPEHIFATSYAAAKLLMHWGLEPDFVAGVGDGEYAAACIADIFDVETALTLLLGETRMDAETFETRAARAELHMPTTDYLSGVTGRHERAVVAEPDYWVHRRARQPKLDTLVKTLHELQCETSLAFGLDHVELVSVSPEPAVMNRLLARCYAAGFAVDWDGVYRERRGRRIHVQGYPFARRRHWLEPPKASAARTAEHPLLGKQLLSAALRPGQRQYESRLGLHEPPFLADYRVHGRHLTPSACLLEMALAAVDRNRPQPLSLNDLKLDHPLPLDAESHVLQTLVDDQSVDIYGLESDGAWRRHFSARFEHAAPSTRVTSLQDLRARLTIHRSGVDFYEHCRAAHVDYGPAFQGVRALFGAGDELLAQIALPDLLHYDQGRFVAHPVLLEACCQPIMAMIGARQTAVKIATIDSLHLYGSIDTEIWSHVLRHEDRIDIHVYGDKGALLMAVHGLCLIDVDTPDEPAVDLGALHRADSRERKVRIETLLHDWLGEILERDTVPVNRSLNQLGVDSLAAQRLSYAVHHRLGVELPATWLLRDGDLSDLAEHVETVFRSAAGAEQGPAMTDEMWVEVLV